MRTARALLCTSMLALFGAGCAGDLPSPNVITFTQILGVAFQVAGDPTRSSPAAGEDLDVQVVVSYAAEHKPITWAFLSCIPEQTSLGIPFCSGTPTVLAQQMSPTMGDPTFTMTVPTADMLGGATQLLLVGAVCGDGALNLPTTIDPTNLDLASLSQACANGSGDGVVMTTPVLLRTADFTNQNPAFQQLLFAGMPWTDVAAPDAPDTGCVGSGVLVISLANVVGGDALPVRIDAAPGSREDYVAQTGDPPMPTPQTEDLQVSTYCTDGEFERTFTFISDPSLSATVDWRLPANPPTDGKLVRFYFGMRDLRGGFDHLERALCIVP